MSTERDKLLSIYLEDHRAGAAGGVALACRIADRYGDQPGFESLTSMAADIKDDQRALDVLRDGVGAGGGYVKRVVAVVGERLGRLKLNGTLVRPSPLSRVLELEALTVGVVAKRCAWTSLITFAGGDELVGVDLAELVRRADDQVVELRRLHEAATDIAFGPRRSAGSDASDPAEPGKS